MPAELFEVLGYMTQAQALNILKMGDNVFLTGEPGSGKTHTINQFVNYLRRQKIEIAITASTGIAATHIGGMTIHSWSGIGIRKTLSKPELKELESRDRLVFRLEKTQVLVIDEISMLDARTLTVVDEVCRALRKSDHPFGGIQVVFVGDFFQLPPVSKQGEEPAEFAFYSPSWRAASPAVCYLSEQHRQSDVEFLSLLTGIRKNLVTNELLDILNRCQSEPPLHDYFTRLYSHNVDVDRINSEKLQALEAEEKIFRMDGEGNKPLIEQLKKGCLSPEVLHLKIGARVMFTKNNFEAGYVNGTLGQIEDFSDDSLPVVRTAKKRFIEVSPLEWSVADGSKILAKISQIPLRLAWAITVHKSQGMTLDAAVMDLGGSFEYGQGYVAISRVRNLSGLFVLKYNRRALEVHPEILRLDQMLKVASEETVENLNKFSEQEIRNIHRNFIISHGGKPEPTVSKPPSKGNGVYSVQEVRINHPQAYAKWTKDEERQLRELYKSNIKIKDIAIKLGRKPGGISSRLKKLGLITD